MTAQHPTALTIRMYNVGFGDCFLLLFKTDQRVYTMLIDCGRLSGSVKEGPDFWEVVQRLIDDLPVVDGHPHADIVVMTHRHRDHVHGFSRPAMWENVTAGEVWMPWTENPDDPTATGLRKRQDTAAKNALGALKAFGVRSGDAFELALNSISNGAAMDTLRGLTTTPIQYLPEKNASTATIRDHSNTSAADVLPLGVTVRILGPSHDPKVIGRLNPPKGQSYLRLAATDDDPGSSAAATVPAPWGGQWDRPSGDIASRIATNLGVTPLKFDELLADVRTGARGDAETLAFDVDNALNGTSLVLLVEVGEHSLLFPGDAQWGTWDVILNTPEWQSSLKRINFLKVGHHGSHNATPAGFVEGGYLRDATAMVSVAPTVNTSDGWKAIPKRELLKALTSTGGVTRLVRSDKPIPGGASGISRAEDEFYTEATFAIGGRR
jgi:beta-lactamase superfamily II metal-dependent hydrolase